MTSRLALTERQARALLRAAEKERGIAEVKIGAATVRLIPAVLAEKKLELAKKKVIDL